MQPGIYSNPSQPGAFIVVSLAGEAFLVPAKAAGWQERQPYSGNPAAFVRLDNLDTAFWALCLAVPGSVWGVPGESSNGAVVWTAAKVAASLEEV